MKKLLLSSLILVSMAACGSSECVITGTITDQVDSVTLIDMSGNLLDASAVTDGSFTLKCALNPELGVSVVRGDEFFPIALIADSPAINVTFADGTPVVTGSPLSEELQEYQQWVFKTYMDATVTDKEKVIADRSRELYLSHTNDLVGVQAMTILMANTSEEEFMQLYEKGGKLIQEDAQIGGYYEHLKEVPKNEIITLAADGEVVREKGSFEDFVGAGKYALVDFWASWCGPCRAEAPNVVAAYEKYRDKGLVVIGIPVNDKQDATIKAMKDLGIHYPQLLDPSEVLAEKFDITGIPHIILFAPDGSIVADDLRGPAIDAALSKVL